MNHRDLKPSNFLVVQHPEPITKYVVIDLEVIEMASSYSLTLIDFGFSCIGSTETQTAELFLSSVYTAEDPCPKEGRDLFLFLGTLYVDFHTRMPADILHLFEQWLNMPDTPNFTQLLREHPNKEEAKKWLYAISGHEEIRSIPCCPVRIFHDLYAPPPQVDADPDAEREQGDQT